jgi:hypothetical protein
MTAVEYFKSRHDEYVQFYRNAVRSLRAEGIDCATEVLGAAERRSPNTAFNSWSTVH